jgi:hypothetical protein
VARSWRVLYRSSTPIRCIKVTDDMVTEHIKWKVEIEKENPRLDASRSGGHDFSRAVKQRSPAALAAEVRSSVTSHASTSCTLGRGFRRAKASHQIGAHFFGDESGLDGVVLALVKFRLAPMEC